jgi:hypothetical protein
MNIGILSGEELPLRKMFGEPIEEAGAGGKRAKDYWLSAQCRGDLFVIALIPRNVLIHRG